MVNSYYKCESGGRTVTVWRAATGESGFYDVVIDRVVGPGSASNVPRVTAYEAAAIVLTELGTPSATTIASVEGMIRRWRDELDEAERQHVAGNRVVTG